VYIKNDFYCHSHNAVITVRPQQIAGSTNKQTSNSNSKKLQ